MDRIIKKNNGKRIGDLFRIYQANKGLMTYKTFQRNIQKLEKGNFIALTKIEGGLQGNTTLVSLKAEKKLTEF